MDHDTTTTDIDALEAEIDALLEHDAAMARRLDALLARTTPTPTPTAPVDTTTSALRRLQRTARHTARLTTLVEQQQAALAAQLDAIEAG
jgi:hypothetical protein